MIQPCDKSINTEIPGTQVKIDHFCRFAKGHTGLHEARGTMNGVEFEVTFETVPKAQQGTE